MALIDRTTNRQALVFHYDLIFSLITSDHDLTISNPNLPSFFFFLINSLFFNKLENEESFEKFFYKQMNFTLLCAIIFENFVKKIILIRILIGWSKNRRD